MDPQEQEAQDRTPAHVQLPHIDIKFQLGPLREVGHNGTTIESVIDVLTQRLEAFQAGPFRCRENALAITNLEQARLWLQERTRKREAAGVEGTNQQH